MASYFIRSKAEKSSSFFMEKVHVAFVHAIVDGGLDVKDVQMFIDNFAEAVHLRFSSERAGSM